MTAPARWLSAARKLHRLRPADAWLLAQMAWLLARVLYLQRRRPLPDLVRAFDPPPQPARVPQASVRRLLRLCRALLYRTHGTDFCMKQSLILFYLLRQRGHPVRIHFGVAKKDGVLAGHAWLDLRGRPLGETQDPRAAYATTFSYPAAPQAAKPERESGRASGVRQPYARPKLERHDTLPDVTDAGPRTTRGWP